MVKKIIIGVVTVIVVIVVLVTAETLITRNKTDSTKANQNQPSKQLTESAYSQKTKEQSRSELMEEKRRRMERMRRPRPRPERLMREGFEPWLVELKKAHQENDKEKIDQLIQKMEQHRESLKTISETRRKQMIESLRKREAIRTRPIEPKEQPTEQE